tara:strand:- start:129 stop:275 length:147 start_codon:yes stop_codon:yes gene_type:complete
MCQGLKVLCQPSLLELLGGPGFLEQQLSLQPFFMVFIMLFSFGNQLIN